MDSSNVESYEMSTHKAAKGFKVTKVSIGVILYAYNWVI